MEKEEIIKKINESKNQPALMLDKDGFLKAVVVKLEDVEESNSFITEDAEINYYEFDNVSIDFQEFPDKERDDAALESIAVKDISLFYSTEELYKIIENIANYQKKNIEEDEAIAKAMKNNCIELQIYIPKKRK